MKHVIVWVQYMYHKYYEGCPMNESNFVNTVGVPVEMLFDGRFPGNYDYESAKIHAIRQVQTGYKDDIDVIGLCIADVVQIVKSADVAKYNTHDVKWSAWEAERNTGGR